MALGWPSVEAGLKQISARELSEWMAFYAVEPFGEERADFRQAITTAAIAEANRNRKRRFKPFGPADFMLPWWEQKKQQSPAEMLEVAKRIHYAMGGE